jgi:hypothetical protein
VKREMEKANRYVNNGTARRQFPTKKRKILFLK